MLELRENDATAFVPATQQWLHRLQVALGNNRLPASARVAAVRALLDTASPANTTTGPAKPTRRLRGIERANTAVRAIKEVVELVHDQVAPTRTRLDEADVLARRVVVLAVHKGIVVPRAGQTDSRQAQAVYRAVFDDPELRVGIIQLDAILGSRDTVIALSRRFADLTP
ncbi:hypothetical protein ACWEVP_47990 [Amycolatopsis sp. NPDC003865]